MRVLRSFLTLILASALITGCFWIIDSNPGLFREPYEKDETEIDVTSKLTQRIYKLESSITDDDLENLSEYETDLDKEIASYLKAHGGGKYTDSSGETHYVSSSSGGGYSGGGYSGGSSGGGGSYDDGPGYLVDVYVDDTEYNICHDCGYEYIGTGDCPNPACPSHNWN